jgi:methionyl-tRNA formyltransferase
MKICIAGKNEISVAALKIVLDMYKKADLCVCPTLDDDGVSNWQPSLIRHASEYSVDIVTLKECYDIEDLVFISVQFDQILRPHRFKTDQLYNVHISKLPFYRGLSPITWAILNGEQESGVTLHEIDHGIDTGHIIDQDVIDISKKDTSRDIYLRCQLRGAELFKKNLVSMVNKTFKSEPQRNWYSTYYGSYSKSPDAYKLNFHKTAFQISCQVRAFSFREYQMPMIDDFPIREVIITSNRSTSKCGIKKKLSEDRLLLSTIDYDCILILDRNEELFALSDHVEDSTLSNLVKAGYSLDLKNRRGWTPLMVACYNGKSNVVEKLLKHGADANVGNANGTVPIMYAKERFEIDGDPTIINLLLNHRVDFHRVDHFGKTVFDYAEQNDQSRFIQHFSGN